MGSDTILDPYVQEWANLAVRWLHMIAGIAWIGSSFYFMWLDASLRKGPDLKEGLKGEVWSVHGGGFYHNIKYEGAPPALPGTLHWFKWEAYATFLSGFALLGIVYYASAEAYMINPEVADISGGTAVLIGLGVLAGWWIFYDLACRSPLGRHDGLLGVVIACALIAVAFGLYQILSARAAYMHVGAMVGSAMVGNVFFVIIPNQKKIISAMVARETPDASLGPKGKQRSVHNNYFTLGVLFVMISGHFPSTYGHEYGWAILAVLFLAGALIRHHFNLKHAGKPNWLLFPIAGVLFVGVAIAAAPKDWSGGEPVSFNQIHPILIERCTTCHSDSPSDPLAAAAPGNLRFDTPEQVKAMAPRIMARAVNARTMPMANRTNMTEEERELVGRWIGQGARIDDVTAEPPAE